MLDCDDEIPEQWISDILSSGEVDSIEEEIGAENRFLPARYEEDDTENNEDYVDNNACFSLETLISLIIKFNILSNLILKFTTLHLSTIL